MCASVVFGQKEKVAVYVTGGKTAGDNEILGEKLVEAITQSQQYVAVERTMAFLQQLSKEQKYQRSGNVDDNDISRLGKQAGVGYVCVAEMVPVQGGDFVTARLIDVERASVVAAADGNDQINSLTTLISVSENLATQMIGSATANRSGSGKKRVAVYIAGSTNENESKVLGAKLVGAITNSAVYVAMERTDAFLKELRKEQGYQQSGNVDDTEMAAIGKQFGVQYVCVVKVSTSSYGGSLLASRLINVETGIVDATANKPLTSTDVSSLVKVTQAVAQEMLARTPEVKAEEERKLAEEKRRKEEAARQVAASFERDMVAVQGGTFTMGCTGEQGSDCDSDEKPAHSVTVSSFNIGKYEVTQAQWTAIMGSNPSSFKKGDSYPVESVSWNDVQNFISKLNAATGKRYRLPTEAEWEFAARGGTRSSGYKYSGSNSVGSVAWYTDNSSSTTHPVGAKQANELGIYDMSGNVREWCSDWYGDYSSSSQYDPKGASSGSYRVDRGGGWYSTAANCRVAFRSNRTPGNSGNNLGFRLVLP
ncbi:MAG: SUMF1/EgtB/PvdO family nonheme iron enzyme [Prevotellaceae bacterium]|nr:SUMF1/EgtB/PvdO family nonheme iron enzyme [Prevotellaceae bacterium]